MYTLAVRRNFIGQHALVGGDWGRENSRNSHRYTIELQIEGETLDQHGFLIDIMDVQAQLDQVVERYRDTLMNDLPEFAGLNPSLEHFSRIIAERLATGLSATSQQIKVVLWEDDIAWASYTAS